MLTSCLELRGSINCNLAFIFRYKGPKDIYIERVLVTSNAEEVSGLSAMAKWFVFSVPLISMSRIHLVKL